MPQPDPWNSFDDTSSPQMKETLLVANPQISRAVSGDGVHLSGRHTAHRNKPAIIVVSDSAKRGDPNSPAFVLKERIRITRQSAVSLPISRNPPVIPSVQTISRAEPNAAIPGRQDRPNDSIRQALLHGDCGDGEVAKAVEAVHRSYPDIAFTILEEARNGIAGEAVRPREQIRPSLVDMQEALVRGSDPQTAIAIPE